MIFELFTQEPISLVSHQLPHLDLSSLMLRLLLYMATVLMLVETSYHQQLPLRQGIFGIVLILTYKISHSYNEGN